MSIPDELISRYFELLTDISDEDLAIVTEQVKSGSVNPRDIKLKLAFTITEEYHGCAEAEKAKNEFINVVSNKGIPDDIEEITGADGKNIIDLLTELNFIQSRGEGKRLLQGGGVKIDNIKITDPSYVINLDKSVVLQAGKRKFAKLAK